MFNFVIVEFTFDKSVDAMQWKAMLKNVVIHQKDNSRNF